MTAEQFKQFWNSTYPDTITIGHCFRHDYPDRWFRIHSLPESKRYADTNEEWAILLNRQNTIITDLLGDNSKILFVTGDYHSDQHEEFHPIEDAKSISDVSFVPLEHIDLHKLSPEEYDQGQVYRPMFSEQVWQKNKFDNILRDIANDQLRAFFISPSKNCIVAPYDGGVDFILKDTQTRDICKKKYSDWLSERDDGL
ncbi:MAG TPA: hypothetical protein DCF44_10630 [Chitinophagaceae bacterium]|nr:hypothetical protein [Chitinophagaceae bacterium]